MLAWARQADVRRGHRLRRGAGVRPDAPALGRAGARDHVPHLRSRGAVATAHAAARGKNLEILGADLAISACSEVLSTRFWCMSCQCSSATVCVSQPRASAESTLNRSAIGSRVPLRCSASACGSRKVRSGRPQVDAARRRIDAALRGD